MRLLVTGGAGFIGGNYIKWHLQKYPGDEIACLDALTYAASLRALSPVLRAPNFRLIRGDIADGARVDETFRRGNFDTVINFAAETHVDRSVVSPGAFIQSNVAGAQVLMDACLKYGVKRFHQVSTDEVYGDLPLNRPELLFREDSPIRASSPYSASKAGADLLAQAYHRTFGLNVTITRCSNNYGAYQFPEKLIPLMIGRALRDEPLPVYGRGANVRDWLYVLDHCSAIDAVARRGQNGSVYNVGGHNERANIDVVKAILRALGKPESLISFVADRPGHDLRYAIDSAKLQSELGWRPTLSFEEGLARTIWWYTENSAWLESVRTGEYLRENERLLSACARGEETV